MSGVTGSEIAGGACPLAPRSHRARRSRPGRRIAVWIALLSLLGGASGRADAQTPPFRFVSWADTKAAVDVLAALSDQAGALNPLFSIYAGDLCENGFSRPCMDAWKTALNGASSNGMFDKTFPVRGNHDAADMAGWQAYLNLRATAARVGAANYSELEEDATYSFDLGNSHFIGVDVPGDATDLSAAQIGWIDADLTSAEQRGMIHAFLFFHGPIYCVAEHCACTARTCPTDPAVARLIEVFNRHPIVSATFHGHEHTNAYVHIDRSRIPEVVHPFEEFVTGDAGAEPAGCLKAYRFDACASSHGFATIDVSGRAFSVKFYVQGNPAPVTTLAFTKAAVPPTPPANLRVTP